MVALTAAAVHEYLSERRAQYRTWRGGGRGGGHCCAADDAHSMQPQRRVQMLSADDVGELDITASSL
jgi:hypothetical protein